MRRNPIVDPHFPTALRRLRQARGLSLRDLAALTYLSKSTLSELENGRKAPSADTAHHLDRALHADGALAGMVTDPPASAPDDCDRIGHVLTHPHRLDDAVAASVL